MSSGCEPDRPRETLEERLRRLAEEYAPRSLPAPPPEARPPVHWQDAAEDREGEDPAR